MKHLNLKLKTKSSGVLHYPPSCLYRDRNLWITYIFVSVYTRQSANYLFSNEGNSLSTRVTKSMYYLVHPNQNQFRKVFFIIILFHDLIYLHVNVDRTDIWEQTENFENKRRLCSSNLNFGLPAFFFEATDPTKMVSVFTLYKSIYNFLYQNLKRNSFRLWCLSI